MLELSSLASCLFINNYMNLSFKNPKVISPWKKLVPEVTYCVSSGTLNSTHHHRCSILDVRRIILFVQIVNQRQSFSL